MVFENRVTFCYFLFFSTLVVVLDVFRVDLEEVLEVLIEVFRSNVILRKLLEVVLVLEVLGDGILVRMLEFLR